ncbi:hypothetical protein J2R80_007777 [Bradyrhizobium sp. USDA 4541]|nr:hypothetical protein [Bradyrhizobium sp. USDA 4541]
MAYPEFEKAVLLAKLNRARDRNRCTRFKVEGRNSMAEQEA